MATSPNAVEYLHANPNVSSVTVPSLWFASPTHGKVGESITLYGQGMGTTQGTSVLYRINADGSRTAVTVATWVRVAGNAVALTDNRVLTNLTATSRSAVKYERKFFSEAASTLTTPFTFVGSAAWSVASGLAGAPTGTATRCFALLAGALDTQMVVTVGAVSTDSGIVLRWVDSSNYIYYRVSEGKLVRVLAGVEAVLATYAGGTGVSGDTFTVTYAAGPLYTIVKNTTTIVSSLSLSSTFDAAITVGLVVANATSKFSYLDFWSASSYLSLADAEHNELLFLIPSGSGAVGNQYQVEMTV